MSDFSRQFLSKLQLAVEQLDVVAIAKMAECLADVREAGGRVFFLGVGGSAANASHAVNDFRKIAGMECYAPSDNVSELTAWTNDEGWGVTYANWLRLSRLSSKDAVFVFSVGGGSMVNNISPNIVRALELAQQVGSRILGVVGRDGGYTAQVADACVVIATVSDEFVTPLVESLQVVIQHLLVSHPLIKQNETKWEAATAFA